VTEDERRFRTPWGLTVIAYKALLGAGEILVGVVLALPWVDVHRLFTRLSAEELREDPSDRLVALMSRSLPGLLAHRGLVAAMLIVLGVAKLAAARAMWRGREWGRFLLLAVVLIALPLDVRAALIDPTLLHVGFALCNLAVVAALAILLR
jgi:hypothetical protein